MSEKTRALKDWNASTLTADLNRREPIPDVIFTDPEKTRVQDDILPTDDEEALSLLGVNVDQAGLSEMSKPGKISLAIREEHRRALEPSKE